MYCIYMYVNIHTHTHTHIIYISDKPLSHFRSDFFLKKIEVICIINLKNTLFKGYTRGGPWVYKGGALGTLSREAKFQQDAKTK